MSQRFQRIGIDYCFAPVEVPVVLLFQRIKDKDEAFTCQLAVQTERGEPVMTRRVDLMAGFQAGALANLTKELHDLNKDTPLEEWKTLLREANESVIRAHRKGRPFMHTQGEISRPAEPAWACQGLLLKNKPNCWLGASSTGKSTLAKAMCAYYASGFRFCDRIMEQGVPLYLDWEDDYDSFNRTVFDVCRNLGVWPLPHMIWRDMHGSRLRNQLEAIAEVIDREQVGLIVLDAVAAAGGATGEYMGWEAIALEMEDCIGVLPPVTVLALDHVTGAEHRAQNSGSAAVPIKARGAERKLEYLRNQWSLVADPEAEQLGLHKVNWYHTKCSIGRKELPFATEIVHREAEISIIPQVAAVPASEPVPDDAASRLLATLATTSGRSVHELCLQMDGKVPSKARYNSVRTTLERAVAKGLATKEMISGQVRYRTDSAGDQGLLIPFPGSA